MSNLSHFLLQQQRLTNIDEGYAIEATTLIRQWNHISCLLVVAALLIETHTKNSSGHFNLTFLQRKENHVETDATFHVLAGTIVLNLSESNAKKNLHKR